MRRDYPDGNAKELLAALEKDYGWICRRIAKARESESGLPDAVVSHKGSRRNHLLEIKSLGGRLNAAQVAFARAWQGCIHVATNAWEADMLLKECEGSRL